MILFTSTLPQVSPPPQLSEIIHPSLDPLAHPPFLQHFHSPRKYLTSPIFKKLSASPIFTYDSTQAKLRYKYFNRTEIQVHFGISKQVLNDLRQHTVQLRPFIRYHFDHTSPLSIFPDFSPFILSIFQSLSFLSLDNALISGHPSTFSPFLNTSNTPNTTVLHIPTITRFLPPTLKYPIPKKNWISFWKFAIPLKARTIWYKLIHSKIPHKSLLFHFFPEKAVLSSISSVSNCSRFYFPLLFLLPLSSTGLVYFRVSP